MFEEARNEHKNECEIDAHSDACWAVHDGLPAKQPTREAPDQHYGLKDSIKPDGPPPQKPKPGGKDQEQNKKMGLFMIKAAWWHMTTNFMLFDIAVYGSAPLHVALTLGLGLWPLMLQVFSTQSGPLNLFSLMCYLQNVLLLQKHKIQQNVPPARYAFVLCMCENFTHRHAYHMFGPLRAPGKRLDVCPICGAGLSAAAGCACAAAPRHRPCESQGSTCL